MIRFIEASSRWMTLLGQSLLCLVILMVTADILLRQTIGFTLPGTVDLVQLGVMASFFLALPSAFLHDANVGVEFITDPLPPQVLALVKASVALLGALFMATMTWYCAGQAWLQMGQGDRSQTIGIPIAFYWIPLLAGSLLSVTTGLLLCARHAVIAAGGRDFLQEAKVPATTA